MKSNLEIAKKAFVCSVAVFLAVSASTIFSNSSLAQDSKVAAATTVDPVEARIKELHDKLKITSDQETLWSSVTKEMRDHAKVAQSLIDTRNSTAAQMTAIDDLKSYANIAQLHADGMKEFLGVFTPLYTAMSDAQKKNADSVFRDHKETHRKNHQTALKG